METCDEVSHAQDKLARKNFDFIVLNSLNDKGAGFRCDTNKITIIDRTEAVSYPLKRKQEVPKTLWINFPVCFIPKPLCYSLSFIQNYALIDKLVH